MRTSIPCGREKRVLKRLKKGSASSYELQRIYPKFSTQVRKLRERGYKIRERDRGYGNVEYEIVVDPTIAVTKS